MLKLLGASLIILAGTLCGMQLGGYLAHRPLQIRQLRTGLTLLETEIVYGSRSLSEALASISRRVGGEAARLFSQAAELLATEQEWSASECWHCAVHRIWPGTALKEPEKDVMLQLGFILGQSDREDQRKHIRLALANLEHEEACARDSQQRYEKMCRSLGVLSGVLLVILLY
ncbi:stage III sporulation protein SpoIIIAB [Aneurinibacillus sp. UBA3580]|jgi:stage III sporulation protein AB|uniref:stage III sporulation protein SpoIIIAB n=1 Tax=Aneurinibacillus sp. UBA3580 TaxID=1946041 RepID=UPI00257D3C21|nr:stage III sporulation protein SpoIIIAB [Aneurinibacillus sp. UBA3580]